MNRRTLSTLALGGLVAALVYVFMRDDLMRKVKRYSFPINGVFSRAMIRGLFRRMGLA